jgi:hypothetical protein
MSSNRTAKQTTGNIVFQTMCGLVNAYRLLAEPTASISSVGGGNMDTGKEGPHQGI